MATVSGCEGECRKKRFGYRIWLLNGHEDGWGELSPFDIIDIYRKTGDVFYRRNQRHLGTSQPMPITPLQGGMGNIINELVLALDTNAKLIEEITGINPVSLGATADSGSAVGITQMSVANSSSPIKNIFDKIFLLKAHTSLDLLQRVQLDLRNSKTVQGQVCRCDWARRRTDVDWSGG